MRQFAKVLCQFVKVSFFPESLALRRKTFALYRKKFATINFKLQKSPILVTLRCEFNMLNFRGWGGLWTSGYYAFYLCFRNMHC